MHRFVFVLFGLGLINMGWAQQALTDTVVPSAQFETSYIIKWNPASLAFGKVGLQGEYNWKNKKSFTLGIGIPVEMTIGYDNDGKREKLYTRTFSAMGGYRFYLGKNNMKGFYFEPYLKYVKNKWTSDITDELDNTPTVFATTSKYSGFGVGAQLGAQFLIGRKIVIDLFFLGPEANMSKHDLIVTDITSTSPWDTQDAIEAQVTIESVFRDEPFIGKKIKINVDANSRTVTSNFEGFLPGIRTGVSIGFRL
jgi:hypothetical protein